MNSAAHIAIARPGSDRASPGAHRRPPEPESRHAFDDQPQAQEPDGGGARTTAVQRTMQREHGHHERALGCALADHLERGGIDGDDDVLARGQQLDAIRLARSVRNEERARLGAGMARLSGGDDRIQ